MNVRVATWLVWTAGLLLVFAGRIASANTAPRISGSPAPSVVVGQSYSFRPRATDFDKQKLTFRIVNKPAWASFDTRTGLLTGTPRAAFAGITFARIKISVTDGIARSALPPFDIRVKSANRAPVISGKPVSFAVVGNTYRFTPRARDPEGKVLKFTIANKPAWATFDPTNGRLLGRPAPRLAGQTSAYIRICASDRIVSTCLPGFRIKVRRHNESPSIAGVPARTASVDKRYAFAPRASDPDRNPVRFLVRNKPAWATFDYSTGRLYGVPGRKFAGTMATDIQIGVTDGYRRAWLPAFAIRVDGFQQPAGTVTLSWNRPVTYTDGSPLRGVDIRGYRIYYGTSADNLTEHLFVGGAVESAEIGGLEPATWYFAMRTVAGGDKQSELSEIVSKNLR